MARRLERGSRRRSNRPPRRPLGVDRAVDEADLGIVEPVVGRAICPMIAFSIAMQSRR
jgi:hypothetical protein